MQLESAHPLSGGPASVSSLGYAGQYPLEEVDRFLYLVTGHGHVVARVRVERLISAPQCVKQCESGVSIDKSVVPLEQELRWHPHGGGGRSERRAADETQQRDTNSRIGCGQRQSDDRTQGQADEADTVIVGDLVLAADDVENIRPLRYGHAGNRIVVIGNSRGEQFGRAAVCPHAFQRLAGVVGQGGVRPVLGR